MTEDGKSLIAYKLFRVRKDGTLGPLFINRPLRVPVGEWVQAESHPTAGYVIRPGWHCCAKPLTPHLSNKGREWFEVEIRDEVICSRPEHQGGAWYLAGWLKVLSPVKGDLTPVRARRIIEM